MYNTLEIVWKHSTPLLCFILGRRAVQILKKLGLTFIKPLFPKTWPFLISWHLLLNAFLFSSPQDKTLFHPVSSSCIDCNPAEKKIFMNRCDPLSETQQWIFEHINMTVLEKFNSKKTSSQGEKNRLFCTDCKQDFGQHLGQRSQKLSFLVPGNLF